MKSLFFGMMILSHASLASTITTFRQVAWLTPGADKTEWKMGGVQSDGQGDQWQVYVLMGATCETQSKASIQQFQQASIGDAHVDLKNGQSTELDGTLYICSSSTSPQINSSH